jgi:hypothetical protein
MHAEPTALDRQIKPRGVFGRRGLQVVQKRPVDELDVDPAMNRFDGIRDIEQLTGCGFRIGIGSFSNEFHRISM